MCSTRFRVGRSAQVGQVIRHRSFETKADHVTRAAKVTGGLAVPDRDEDVRMGGYPRAGFGVLAVALGSVIGDRLRRVPGCHRQDDDIPRVTRQPAKLGPGAARLEILCVQVFGHGHRDDEIDSQVLCDARHQAVGAFRERR